MVVTPSAPGGLADIPWPDFIQKLAGASGRAANVGVPSGAATV